MNHLEGGLTPTGEKFIAVVMKAMILKAGGGRTTRNVLKVLNL